MTALKIAVIHFVYELLMVIQETYDGVNASPAKSNPTEVTIWRRSVTIKRRPEPQPWMLGLIYID